MMTMTHYMALLADNQPWNLLLFMAIPVILAETVAITELYLLVTRKNTGSVAMLSRVAGILGGIYFTGVFFYLFSTAVIPLTQAGGWYGVADIIAVWAYLLGVFPLVTIALLDARLIAQKATEEKRRALHAGAVAVFLVVAHIAMIFGMVNPEVFGYMPPESRSNSMMDDMWMHSKSVRSAPVSDPQMMQNMDHSLMR